MLKVDNPNDYISFFKDVGHLSHLPFFISTLTGYGGSLFVDDIIFPQLFVLKNTIYLAIVGNVNKIKLEFIKCLIEPKCWIVSDTYEWLELIARCYPKSVFIKRDSMIFDGLIPDKYDKIISSLPSDYEIQKIDANYANIIAESWCSRLLIGYNSIYEFDKYGIGYCIIKDGFVVSGATSLLRTASGAELQIMTHHRFEHKNFAKISCINFILHCINKNTLPFWEAANATSRHIAESLNFHLNFTYDSLYISENYF